MKYLYKPKGVILHCTASENKAYTIDQIFLDHIRRGFECIGYHYIITTTGEIYETRPTQYYGAHCKGYNDYIGIAYMGGIKNGKPTNTLNIWQEESMLTLAEAILYNQSMERNIKLHNELANKACPSFSRSELLRMLSKYQIKFENDIKRRDNFLNSIQKYQYTIK